MSSVSHCALVAFVFWAAPALAGGDALDLIREDAAVVIAIQSQAELQKKGDKLIADSGIKIPARPSQVFDGIYGYLKISASVDRDGSAAIMLANTQETGLKLEQIIESLVGAVPFHDLDKIGAAFKFKPGELQRDKMAMRDGNNFGKFFYARGNHLFFGINESAVASVATGRSVRAALSKHQVESLRAADILVHFSANGWGDEWNRISKEMEAGLHREDHLDKELRTEIVESFKNARFSLTGIQVDEGLYVHSIAALDAEKSEATQKLLARLAIGSGSPDLQGLPEGNVLAAYAIEGDGSKNATLAVALMRALPVSLRETVPALRYVAQPAALGIFSEVWQRLNGSRLAVYLNDDESKHGLLSIVAILDTEQPEEFCDNLKQLARLAAVESQGGDKGLEEGEIDQLIQDLGAAKFAVRQSASTKLGLIGDPALPKLQQALMSNDQEVKDRANRLITQITQASAARRKALLSKDVLSHLSPTFAYIPEAESFDEHSIDQMQVQLTAEEVAALPQLKQLLGPGWDKIRLARHGKHVVVLFGSEPQFLKTALENLSSGRPGLAAHDAPKRLREVSGKQRKMELHVSIEKVLALTAPKKDKPVLDIRAGSLSSLGISVEANRLEIDFFMPLEEFKVSFGKMW